MIYYAVGGSAAKQDFARVRGCFAQWDGEAVLDCTYTVPNRKTL
jgi:hypothetical protein